MTAKAALRGALIFVVLVSRGQSDSMNLSQTAQINLGAIGKLVSIPTNTSFSLSATQFSAYTASLPLSYRIRTGPAGSASALTAKITTEFAPATGPQVSTGSLQYTCSAATLGTACSGPVTASTSSQTSVLAFAASACTGGGGSCSSSDPNSMTLTFQLANRPSYKTGSYSATLTLTISAL